LLFLRRRFSAVLSSIVDRFCGESSAAPDRRQPGGSFDDGQA
jgi:hypothetical protein